jgi:hypothetical protein
MIPADGEHHLQIKAKDTAGNWKNATYILVCDDQGPQILLDNVPDTLVVSDSFVQLNIADVSNVSTVLYAFDADSGYQVINSPYILTLPESTGKLVLHIRANDTLGNVVHNIYELELQFQHVLDPPILLYPNGGEVVNGTIFISWTNVSQSPGQMVTYSVYFSADNGSTWSLLQANQTGVKYAFDTTTVDDGFENLIRVIAYDNYDQVASDASDRIFIIVNNQNTRLDRTTIIMLVSVFGVATTVGIIIQFRRRRGL